ncbi:hypothetical protein [Paraburkholderia tagetis]|uniref:Uncharacterized protein n=1 Tax=Paraburkholderia tagetis TaxID=2913261 RepID=A0A9X1RJF8_9BURK|nr:hypothetical protein [Paraburkholderia tagetis]MCG5072225.1 hypothetical protein [Paraburkholderia tagetis]
MPCTPFRFPGGINGIVCTGRKRTSRCSVEGCNAPSGFQCDYQMKPGKTCDRHLCAVHAHQVGADVHFCPAHLAESSGKKQGDLF